MSLTKNQKILAEAARAVAQELGDQGKSLSGLIGELAACRCLDLEWGPGDGYDAVSRAGRRVQVKTRKSWSTQEVNPLGTLGRFGRKAGYNFDDGVLVELDSAFEAIQIWQVSKEQIETLEQKRLGKGLHVGTFKRHAQRVYVRDEKIDQGLGRGEQPIDTRAIVPPLIGVLPLHRNKVGAVVREKSLETTSLY
jgi:hypothetical protein